jgi:arylsulfatase A-like enzyme
VIGDFSPKIPLVIADPRTPAGNVVGAVVRSIDIAPTLLELAGIASPANADGVSLAPWLRGEDPGIDLPAYNETGIWLTRPPGMPDDHLCYPQISDLLYTPDTASGALAIKPEYRNLVVQARDRMVRAGRWKLTHQPLTNGAICRLFDVVTDPDCRNDVSREQKAIFLDLKRQLDIWIREDIQILPAKP